MIKRFEHEPVPPQTSGKLLPVEFALPEMEMVPGKELGPINIPFVVEYRGLRLDNNLILKLVNQDNSSHLARLMLKVTISDEIAAEFTATIHNSQSRPEQHGVKPDNDKHKYLTIDYRKVYPDYRKQGLGEYGIRVMEELSDRVATKWPDMEFEWIQINTQLASMARLIIDQNWTREHNLAEFGSANRDLGYIPYKDDEYQVPSLLESATEEVEDKPFVKTIRFVKQKS